MKTKLLGAVGACVLALTVGTANASTFYVDGTFLYSTVTIFPDYRDYSNHISDTDVGASLSGTVTITNGVLTSVNLRRLRTARRM